MLYAYQVEFERTHDLVKLATLLDQNRIELPISQDRLRMLNPFAVTFRYDDLEIELIEGENVSDLVAEVRQWAEQQVRNAADCEDTQD